MDERDSRQPASFSTAEFAGQLRALRKARGVTQASLASQSGLSVHAVQAYEQGNRVPDEAAVVDRICVALGADRQTRIALRASAGLPLSSTGLLETMGKLRASPVTIWDELEASEWVTLVMNENHEIVAWSGLASAVAELDLGALDASMGRNLLRMAATEHFDAHLQNWNELIGRLISVLKGEGATMESPAGMPAYLQALIGDIAQFDSRFLPRLFQLWSDAPIWPDGARNLHRIEWRMNDGTDLLFVGVFREWSVFDGLSAFDWHAADAATSTWLERARGTFPDSARAVADATEPVGRALVAARHARQLTRAELSAASGVSISSIEAYERGQRQRPRREPLLRLCSGLGLDQYRTNSLLRASGYEEEPSDYARWMAGAEPVRAVQRREQVQGSNVQEIVREADMAAWPCFVLDGRCHVVHANAPAERLTHLSRLPVLPGRPAPHLMQLAVNREIRARLLNWAEVVSVVLPGRLQPLVLGHAGGVKQASELLDVTHQVNETDREGLVTLFDIWAARPNPVNPRRIAVKLWWSSETGERLAFHCLLNPWNAYDPYWAMDWHPADAHTFNWLKRRG